MLHQVGNFVTIPRYIPGASKNAFTWPAKVVDVCTSSSSRSYYKLRYAETDCAVREVDRVVSFEYAEKHMKPFPEGHAMRIVTQGALVGTLSTWASHSMWGRDYIRACLRALREKVDARARSKGMRETCEEMAIVLGVRILEVGAQQARATVMDFFDDSSDFVAHVHDHCASCVDDDCEYPLCKAYKEYGAMLVLREKAKKNDIKGKFTM